MIAKGVPFYANTPDGTHCYQAVIRSILKYFEPAKEFDWPQLESMTAKVEGLWTWPMAGELWLQEHGYEVYAVTLFDYVEFVRRGGDYMIEKNGRAVAEKQIAHSNIPQEQAIAKEFLAKARVEKRLPDFTELSGLLTQGYLVICNVNSRLLNGKDGYSGHFVLVVGVEGDSVVLHDPGGKLTPGKAYRRVPKDIFEAAWAYPDKTEKEFIAVRTQKQ